jgi:putative ABC transport system permease protein
MNLMLARVLRRQRDIGIMRTIGASRRVIGAQVLSEAVALGVLGGLLGLAAAFGLLAAYNSYMLALSVGSPVTEITTSMRWGSAGVGVGVAVAVSLIFGAYPATVAARVRPVSALRGI